MNRAQTARTTNDAEASTVRNLEQRLRIAHTVSSISARLARTENLDADLDASLCEAGILVGADRAYVFQFRDEGTVMDNSHEWCAPDVTPQIEELQGLPSETFGWFVDKVKRGEAFQIADVGALPPEAEAERLLLEAQDIKSLVITPMGPPGHPTGFVGFDNVRDAGDWRPEDTELLQVMSQLVGDALERRRSQQALELSLQRQVAILENIPDIAWLKDADSRYIHVNEPFARSCGVAADELIGKTDLHIWPQELADQYLRDDAEVIGLRRRKRIEEPLADKDLGERLVETVKTPVFDGNGRVVGTTGIARDVTDRKRTELAIRESEDRHRRLVESLPAIVYRYSASKGASYWSPQVEQILGYSQQALLTNPFLWHDAIHPDDLPLVDQAIEAFEVGAQIDLNYRIRDANGDWHWFHDRSTGRLDLEGEVVIEGLAFDITSQKSAEEALAQEREQALITLHSIGDGVITTDAEGRVRYLNPVAESFTGWTCAEAEGRPLAEVFRVLQEDTDEPAENPVSRILHEGHIVGRANHTVLISRTGIGRIIEDSGAPIRDARGRTVGVVVVFKDITERRRLDQQVAYAATHDSLTGLVNRATFDERLDQALEVFLKQGTPHVLCYLDLDQFKVVNDAAGHTAGDEMLKQVAALLSEGMRSRDTLARLGGDEFGLLLDDCSLDDAVKICGRLIHRLANFRFAWRNRRFGAGVSIGLVPFTPEAAERSVLTSRADMACFAAKDMGRNRLYVYRPDDAELTRRHREIMQAAELREALEREQFELYAQPIVSAKSPQGEPCRFEILIRLRGRNDKLLTPGAFIPVAERYGLIGELDRWVIGTALREYAALGDRCGGAGLAINLSGISLNDESLPSFVRSELAVNGLAPSQICFEITETTAVNRLSVARRFIEDLRGYGCSFALDDFGSGLSSFNYLKHLPVDCLKVDGGFVRNIANDPVDNAMVKAINEIGHVMGIKTVAEHVETQAVLAAALASGVDFLQGFAVGRPVPLREIDVRKPGVRTNTV